jgi:outer membrane murein-binding lipoprotein Lpp
MKRLLGVGIAAALVAGGLSLPVYAATNMDQMRSEHERLAAHYEQLAADQEALIQEHEEMIKSGKTKFVNPKADLGERLQAMEDHCMRIIKNAETQRDEFRDMAQWHRESAELL